MITRAAKKHHTQDLCKELYTRGKLLSTFLTFNFKLFIESTSEETMENFCLIASKYGHIDLDEEENIHFFRDIHFT